MPQNPPPIILDLVEHFERNIESYRSPAYNEAQVRQEFINPFFEALGWDVANKERHAEAYKDVIHEDAIKVGAPDYCFRIGGARKFFLEAKKPAVNIKEDPDPAYQLRRYAWSAKLPLSILTDFEEFAVYDCRARPSPSDKASAGRIHYLTYKEYATRWDEIASVFSKDAVLKGSFDRYAVSERKRGTTTVDAEFLAEIEKWREDLAKNLAVRNTALDVHELNFAVQRTIDRLIFLRICEDRGIEPYAQLQALLNGENIYGRLRHLYEQADDRYNSGLFHFRSEKERAETPDELTLKLKVDDKVLKDIIRGLYYPESPYEFSVMPAEILGQVYEQFLGKVIRLTSGHQAKVEEKPEVKKAGGVYYTPAYIVAYIVRNTAGNLCEGKTPKQISKLKILDPACGSGSFLIGAYDYLVAYHRDWYLKDGAEKHTKELYQGAGGLWHLATQEKKRILLNNIYGVDIDSQAVEVTKLSLLLKVLEGENQETLKKQLKMWHERALPDLGRNIKCGNSLIGSDYFSGQLLPDDDEMRRVNPFDWNAEFPEIMKASGFDAVIGNPPYAYRNATEDMLRPYYLTRYKCAEGNFDLYKFFIERGLGLVRRGGYVGLIVSATFMIQPSFRKLRALLTQSVMERLAPLGPKAFVNATVDTTIIVARRETPSANHKVVIQAPKCPTDLPIETEYSIKQSRFSQNDGIVFDYRLTDDGAEIAARLFGNFPLIETSYEFGVGINTGFIRDELVADSKVDKRYHPMVAGDGISRYGLVQSDKWIMYDKEYIQKRGELGRSLPAEHLLSSEKILVVRTRNLSLPRRVIATLDQLKGYNLNRLSNIVARPGHSLPGLLGILNSQVFNWLFSTRYYDYEIKPVYLRAAPLANSNDPALIKAVERMLDLHKRLAKAKEPDDKIKLQRQIDATDCEIDRLVYDLYGLTEDEIGIVEGKVVASGGTEWENTDYEDASSPSRHEKAGRQAAPVAKASRHAGESGGGASQSAPGSSSPVHGVRERTGEYGPPEDPSERAEGEAERLGSTRSFETAEGALSYTQVSERLVVSLAGILQEILLTAPEQITITPEWLCLRHQALAGHLFPEWAGRFRNVNVQVGAHTPPPFHEVPVLIRLFCDDLAERLRHIRPQESEAGVIAELLAWADGRFQGIHPFKDFNGRIGRVLLAAVLYKLALPHVETAPLEAGARRQYLHALQAADNGDLGPLTGIWTHRIAETL